MVALEEPGTTVDAAAYRQVMRRFATGVTVITAAHAGEIHGMTANALTSVSLDPVLLLVCFMKESHTGEAVRASGRFMINMLDETQRAVAAHFARPGSKGPAPAPIEIRPDGLPFLPEALAHLVCRVHSIVTAGDHDVVIVTVEECSARPGAPLLYYAGAYHMLGPSL